MAAEKSKVSVQSLKRMPYYVRRLAEMRNAGVERVSATSLAAELQLNEVQVRKDLAAISRIQGKPRSGFLVAELLEDMKEYLGYTRLDDAVLVGAGSIGRALMGYRGFEEYGLRIVAAFDVRKEVVGGEIAGTPVYDASLLEEICPRLDARIGILAVPAKNAQEVCDAMTRAGILAIWNFAPVRLTAPEGILIHNENMAASLAMLSMHLREKLQREAEE